MTINRLQSVCIFGVLFAYNKLISVLPPCAYTKSLFHTDTPEHQRMCGVCCELFDCCCLVVVVFCFVFSWHASGSGSDTSTAALKRTCPAGNISTP